MIEVPPYRNDVESINDIAEEVARAIGYNNINKQTIDISFKNELKINHEEKKIKKFQRSPIISLGVLSKFQKGYPIDQTL